MDTPAKVCVQSLNSIFVHAANEREMEPVEAVAVSGCVARLPPVLNGFSPDEQTTGDWVFRELWLLTQKQCFLAEHLEPLQEGGCCMCTLLDERLRMMLPCGHACHIQCAVFEDCACSVCSA